MQNNSILRNLIALTLIPGLGTKRVKHLVRECNDLENLFSFSKTQLRSFEGVGEASALAILSFKEWEQVDALISDTAKTGAQIITISDPEYPTLLKEIYDPPILFWMKGNPEALSKPGIAVVGTRNASTYGKKQTERFTTQLAEAGLCIFSGLAYGIDTIGHQAALNVGAPTVAVLGSGIDNLYPKSNAEVANQIVKSGGAVISEFPPGTMPDKGNFPLRNRIVSGLSLGVVVMESGIKGGSMITAELALDQNREVFALPHPLGNPSGTGCNYLIKKGAAKLVQIVDDILVELPIDFSGGVRVTQVEETKVQTWRDFNLEDLSIQICEKLENGDAQIDDLADALEKNTSEILVALLQLEMGGLVLQKAGKIFQLK
ncbi:MAG: DNA-processing protein DprA [Balneola sp.]